MELATSKQIRRMIFWAGLWYGLFVIYGSLMPFQFQSRDFDDALAHYLASEADGIAGISWRDFLTNIALFVPLGFLGAGALLASPPRSTKILSLLLVIGGTCLLSALIEFLQLYFPPRVSWTYDVVGNCLGSFGGYLAWKTAGPAFLVLIEQCSAAQRSLLKISWSPRYKLAISLAYVVGLAFANSWLRDSWLSYEVAMTRLSEFAFLPFYYYQDASTWVALRSMLWHFAMYIPIGIGLIFVSGVRAMPGKSRFLVVGATGSAIAFIFEAGKIFLALRHPDSGNIVVGALAAVTGFFVLPCFLQGIPGAGKRDSGSANLSPTVAPFPISIATVVALGMMLSIMGIVAHFPVLPGVLAICLMAYAVLLMRWPHVWLLVVPAALPVLDLAAYSGWFFLDEFDLLILVTLTVLIWQRWTNGTLGPRRGAGYWLMLAFALSTLASLAVGVLPLQAIDENAFSHYFSHYNALRVAKGVIWAMLLLPLVAPSQLQEGRWRSLFSIGVVIGLAGAAMLAVWERAVYPGLFNFSSEFRIGEFFSSMHNGGSHIEAYFTMAMPFALIYAYVTKSQALRLLLGGLFLISSYVVLVTFARGGYGAFALSLLIVVAIIWRAAYLEKRRNVLLALGGLISACLLLAAPVLMGTFAQQRIAASGTDLVIRESHWENSLRLMTPGVSTGLFGMGLGRFPENYYFGIKAAEAPAVFRYGREADNNFLTLGTGQPLYVEQIVDVTSGQTYHLSFDTRNAGGQGAVNALLCERTYFYSYGCVSATLKHETAPGKWSHHETDIPSGSLGAGPWLGRRAVKLSFENVSSETTLDVDNIVLSNASGTNLVTNGGFDNGHSNWFFSSPFNHLPWHIKNLWIGLYFDQGWFGILTFAGIVFFAFFTLARSAWKGNVFAGASLASLAGFLSIGLFDSLFDAPRLITLMFLILFIPSGLLVQRRRASSRTQAVVSDIKVEAAAPRHQEKPSSKPLRQFASGAPDYWSARHMAVGTLILAAAVWLFTHLPQVPYNLRALPNPYHPVLAPLILAAFLYWVLACPAWTARWMDSSKKARFLFPLWVMLHGGVAWALVRNGILPIMLHKVTGAPVLDWTWEWETLIRFTVLEGTLFALLTGGTIIARVLWERRKPGSLIAWLACVTCLLPIAYSIIVTNAATDNLVELIAGEGSAVASLFIALWVVLVGVGAFPVAKWMSTRGAKEWRQIIISILSLPLGYALLSMGMEPALEKYGQVFSGIQFLLSMDRLHYATGWDIWLRYGIFHSLLLCAIALAQYPLWLNPRNPDRNK